MSRFQSWVMSPQSALLPPAKVLFFGPQRTTGFKSACQQIDDPRKSPRMSLTAGHPDRPPRSAQTLGCDSRCSLGLDEHYN